MMIVIMIKSRFLECKRSTHFRVEEEKTRLSIEILKVFKVVAEQNNFFNFYVF